jgi:hypothetical protein
MPKVKEITVTSKRTVGLPGYSSISKDASITVTIEDGDKIEEVYKKAWEYVNEQVKKQLIDYVDPDWIDDDSVLGINRGNRQHAVMKGGNK